MANKSPVVVAAAGRGELWAVKLSSLGWRSLSKAQKTPALGQLGLGLCPSPWLFPAQPDSSPETPPMLAAPGCLVKSEKSMTVFKSEFLGELHADNTIRSYRLDPRNVRTFPHISDLARGFNKYKFTDVKVRYSSKVQDSECGLTIAFSADSSDPAPRGKFDLYALGSKVEGAAHKNLLYTVPVDKGQRFLRDGEGDNAKEVDAGVIYVLMDGAHDTRAGELFLEVTVVLSQPTYNQRSTQYISGTEHRGGPNYVNITKSANTMTLTFQAAGTFLLCSYSSPLEKVGRLSLADADQSQVDSANNSSNIIEAVVTTPGGSIVFYFKSRDQMSFRAYVGRM
uniref:Capsid protein n=1 Tax=Elderberry latent virus TaxID=167018 RepID=A0A0A7M941_9TOMB|nr:coat protein [Elderberry latent virus]